MAKPAVSVREREEETDLELPPSRDTVMVPNVVERAEVETGDDDDSDKGRTEVHVRPNREERLQQEEEGEEDSRLAYDDSGEDGYEERRGTSRRSRRNASRRNIIVQKDATIQALSQKLDEMQRQVQSISRGNQNITIASIDAELSRAQQARKLAGIELAKAVAAGDEAKAAELLDLRDEATSRVFQYENAKRRLAMRVDEGPDLQEQQRGGQVQQGQPGPMAVDDRAQNFIDTFLSRYPYFDPNGGDEDSRIMKAIDDGVAREGYLPNTPVYWRTLERRLRARGFNPEVEGRVRDGGNDDDDDDSRESLSRREEPRRTERGAARPPTSGGRGSGTGQRGFKLEPYMREYLEGEGILFEQGLDDEQKAKRSRLIAAWKENTLKARRNQL